MVSSLYIEEHDTVSFEYIKPSDPSKMTRVYTTEHDSQMGYFTFQVRAPCYPYKNHKASHHPRCQRSYSTNSPSSDRAAKI